jgi:hypothetical protein
VEEKLGVVHAVFLVVLVLVSGVVVVVAVCGIRVVTRLRFPHVVIPNENRKRLWPALLRCRLYLLLRACGLYHFLHL